MTSVVVFTDFKITCLIIIVIAYVMGSISPSIIQGRLAGIDIRKTGSGNAGTTNVLRTLGKKAAVITLVVDVLKGVIAVTLGTVIFGTSCGYICALAVFCGHIWPFLYQFKGGKGVATAFGTLLAVNWKVALCVLLVVVIVTLLSKRMSAGSICGAAAFPFIALWLEPGFVPVGFVMAVIVIVKHRANIKRILKGEEPPLGFLVKKK